MVLTFRLSCAIGLPEGSLISKIIVYITFMMYVHLCLMLSHISLLPSVGTNLFWCNMVLNPVLSWCMILGTCVIFV